VYCVFSADSSLEKLFRKSSAYPDKVRIHEKLQRRLSCGKGRFHGFCV
ncbi:hypothetical protein RRG08_018720, partial [Elysia crispata]